jgi:hypothetical protein
MVVVYGPMPKRTRVQYFILVFHKTDKYDHVSRWMDNVTYSQPIFFSDNSKIKTSEMLNN